MVVKIESMPNNTIVIKNKNTHKFGQGKIANAFGNILKLSSGPYNNKSSI